MRINDFCHSSLKLAHFTKTVICFSRFRETWKTGGSLRN